MKAGFYTLLAVAFLQSAPEARMTDEPENTRMICDFNMIEEMEDWEVVNDTVMGGISESEILPGTSSTMIFRGTVSLERNGGFASVRWLPTDIHLSGRRGVALRAKGDGKRYKLIVKTDSSMNAPNYQAAFDSKEDDWETYEFLFEDFVPSFRGRILSDYPDIEPEAICVFGILIADKQQGPFRIELDWLQGLPEEKTSAEIDRGNECEPPNTPEGEE
jgi:monofunctional biosynthetic peptidoglycan transglycosylase